MQEEISVRITLENDVLIKIEVNTGDILRAKYLSLVCRSFTSKKNNYNNSMSRGESTSQVDWMLHRCNTVRQNLKSLGKTIVCIICILRKLLYWLEISTSS